MSNPQNSSARPSAAQDLRGKVALVTGGSRGIGRAISFDLARRGASILATCSAPTSMPQIDSLNQAVIDLYKTSGLEPPKVVGLSANLLADDFHEAVANKIRHDFNGKLNIVINNAAYCDFRPIGQLDAVYVQKVLLGNIQCLVLLVDELYKRGYIQPASRIINVSSDAVRTDLPFSGMAVFASAKASMECMTRAWADIFSRDEKTYGTTVNTLSVGGTATDAFIEHNTPERQAAARKVLQGGKPAHGGLGRAEDIADVVGLLVGEASHWINGSVVSAGGGAVKVM